MSILLILLPLFIFSSAQADDETNFDSNGMIPVQVKMLRDSDILAQVGSDVIKVGELNKDQELMVYPLNSEYYELTFGNAHGLIQKDSFLPILKSKKQLGLALAGLQKINQNLITTKEINMFDSADVNSTISGVLEGNLRYPIMGRLRDKNDDVWYEINIGDDIKYVRAEDCELDDGVPILTYHHVLKDDENKLFRHTSTTTSDVAFDAQMAYLKEAGYQTISMYQLEGYLNNTVNIPAKAVVLTFDDGLKSVHRYAYPILKKYGQQATAFIISSRIKHQPQPWDANSLQFMSISEMKEIQSVFDIQSHTHFLHRYSDDNQPVLLSRTERNIELDLERSARALSQFNPKVLYVSYPFGGYNDKAIQAAKLAGYHMAVTTVKGKVKPGDNPFTLKRLYILSSDSIPEMAKRIANGSSEPVPMYQLESELE
ncbi:polysaccharide deacetylase family protein [Budvicia diplopodorum]|uniref:polysaccharide deacetylase family protein n=1 Tax=Budvicia diplopodorum TaxID=1119056 RepID=UPI003CCCB2E5